MSTAPDPGYRLPTETIPTASTPTTATRTTSPSGAARHSPTGDTWRSTEFLLTVAFVALVLLATYIDEDTLARTDGWRYASYAVVAYVVSRGLAKLGRSSDRP